MLRLLLMSLLLCYLGVSGQQLKGKITDTLDHKNLQHAVISLVNTFDSSLYKFTRSDKDGQFSFSSVNPGKYTLLVSYPGFADFSDQVEMKNNSQDLGVVPLTLKSRLMDAVIIKSASSIRIKGDTTEFLADSFHVKDGATVEDLLKKFPGFQVNSKGEITAQGQRVQKVLVDGEEFFGDDPTMATQNITAKAVDKVQVYDTKSEQQNLTGISTGNEGKTLNIKLKESARHGAFGKAHVASDFNKFTDAKALYNQFRGPRKISLYGTKSDISTGSLNWEDKQKLGIEDDMEYDEVNGYYMVFGSTDEFSNWALKGLPHSYTAGGLYSNKWNQDKNNLNLSYRFNRLGTVNTTSNLTQNILSSGITYQNQYQNTRGITQQHAGNFKYEWKIDSLASVRFTTAASYKQSDLESHTNSEYLNEAGEYRNKGSQDMNNHSEKKQMDNLLTYKQMFKKKNRLFLATFRYGQVNDDQDGVVLTRTGFYRNNVQDSTDIADQEKIRQGVSHSLGTKLTWSEPLTSKWNLVLDYALNKNQSTSHRNTFNKDINGKYADLDSLYSNNFDLDVLSHSGNSVFRYMGKKWRASFGSGLSDIRLHLMNLDSGHTNRYHFVNVTPQASIRYAPKPQSGIFLNYMGTTRQPSVDQLQPLRDNADRLNIFVGNPDLKVGFNHNFNLGYNSFKILNQTYMYAALHYTIPVNSIAFYNSVDVSRGTRTYTPVNVNGNRNWNLYANLFRQKGEKKISYGYNVNANGGKNINFVQEIQNGNGLKKTNITRFMNSYAGISLRYSNGDKSNFSIRPSVGYNSSTSSLRPEQNSNYWNYGGNVEAGVQLPGKLDLSSDVDFNFQQRLAAFNTNLNQVIWNASLSKKLFKDKGKVYLIANDILDQNRGFDRNISSNFITENRYSKVSRYFLLKFEWSFNKMPGGEKK